MVLPKDWRFPDEWKVRKQRRSQLQDMAIDALKRLNNIPNDRERCAGCGTTQIRKEHFTDYLSWKEYSISQLCQKCQDEIFKIL